MCKFLSTIPPNHFFLNPPSTAPPIAISYIWGKNTGRGIFSICRKHQKIGNIPICSVTHPTDPSAHAQRTFPGFAVLATFRKKCFLSTKFTLVGKSVFLHIVAYSYKFWASLAGIGNQEDTTRHKSKKTES